MANKFPGIKAYNCGGEPTNIMELYNVWFLDYTNATYYTVQRYATYALEHGSAVPDRGTLWELMPGGDLPDTWEPRTPKDFDAALKDAEDTTDPYDYD